MQASTIAVIPEAEVLDEAYSMGYDRFSGAGTVGEESDPFEALNAFKEYAQFSDNVLPSLRALSGYVDSGPGTYTVEREAVVVPVGSGDDLPRDGQHIGVQFIHEKVTDSWERGAMDALEGNDRGENDDVTIC